MHLIIIIITNTTISYFTDVIIATIICDIFVHLCNLC